MKPEKPTFLYVEDDEMSRTVMEMILKRMLGYTDLAMLEDSANFIERVDSLGFNPDVFFLDIHMEPYTGFDMLEMLRGHPDYQDATVIALTASVMNEEVQRLRDAGFDGAIAKPIDQKTFGRTVERILNGESVWRIV